MNKRTVVSILSMLAMLLTLASGLASITLDDGGGPYTWTSLRGEEVEMYGGHGLYQYDSFRKAIIVRGFDWANLVVGLPLLILGLYLHKRGQLRGELLLSASFGYLAYNYLIAVMGNAFNALFLVWTALFSVGLFGVALVVAGIDKSSLPARFEANFPRRSLAAYVILLALFLLFQYVIEVLSAYTSGTAPTRLGSNTTLELSALELGIMVPLHFLGGVLLWQKKPVGYLLAIILTLGAFMTFISLSFAVITLHFFYARGGVFEVALLTTLAGITAVFSLLMFKRVKNEAAPAR